MLSRCHTNLSWPVVETSSATTGLPEVKCNKFATAPHEESLLTAISIQYHMEYFRRYLLSNLDFAANCDMKLLYPLVKLHNTWEEYFIRHGFGIAKDLLFTDLYCYQLRNRAMATWLILADEYKRVLYIHVLIGVGDVNSASSRSSPTLTPSGFPKSDRSSLVDPRHCQWRLP